MYFMHIKTSAETKKEESIKKQLSADDNYNEALEVTSSSVWRT